MTKLRFVLDLPDADYRDTEAVKRRFIPLQIALNALTDIDVWHFREAIRNGSPLPRLYDSGVYYEEEPPGQEDWLDVKRLYKDGKGDCEDLGCCLAAERRVYDGINAMPCLKWKYIHSEELRRKGYPKSIIPRDGLFLVHILTQLPDGTIEDPSKVLGMKGDFQ